MTREQVESYVKSEEFNIKARVSSLLADIAQDLIPANFNEAAADLNGDGEIDLSDAIIITYISLGLK